MTHPEWLLLCIPMGVMWWWTRTRTRSRNALRLATGILVILGLVEMRLPTGDAGRHLVVLADRSQSMPSHGEATMAQWIEQIRQSKDPADRVTVLSFAAQVKSEPLSGEVSTFAFQDAPERDQSRLADAIRAALSQFIGQQAGRIAVFSDGLWTGIRPQDAAMLAGSRGVPIDAIPLCRGQADDLAIGRLDAPTTVARGEQFLLHAWLNVPRAQIVEYEFLRASEVVASGREPFNAGAQRLTFMETSRGEGVQSYTFRVKPGASDPMPENNTARIHVSHMGAYRVLWLSQYEAPLSLQSDALDIEFALPGPRSQDELMAYAAVVLEDVPAESLGTYGMEQLSAWVQNTGGGLVVTGGKHAFGRGGYFRSPLEAALPVTLELRHEHRKFSLALMAALDRSGSMGASVWPGICKMDLANRATVAMLELLSPMDEFGAIAVDSSAHLVSPMAAVKNVDRIRDRILRIKPMGGGIFVYEALSHAVQQILKANTVNRHILLFADAADAEEPGDYRALLEQCVNANITVSVVGLGTEADADAQLLKEIAQVGKGMAYFTEDPGALPRIFAQDTFVVARSTWVDQVTPVEITAESHTLFPQSWGGFPPVPGYNLVYARPRASVAAISKDEYQAPITAFWTFGLGRVICLMAEWRTSAFENWARRGEWLPSLMLWAASETNPWQDGALLAQHLDRGDLVVDYHLSPERKSNPFQQEPELRCVILGKDDGDTLQVPFSWTDAHTLSARITLTGQDVHVPLVCQNDAKPVRLTPVSHPYSPEFEPVDPQTGQADLEELARMSGGTLRMDPAGIWADVPGNRASRSLTPWFLLIAVMLFLLEIADRRFSLFGRVARESRRAAKPVPPESGPEPKQGLSQALKKASQSARQRMQ